jgi:hypothetical protein
MNSEQEDFDPKLARLFEETRQPLAEDEFVSTVLARVQHAHRIRLLRQSAAVLAVMILSGVVAPYAARESLVVLGWLGERLPTMGSALVSPPGWMCSLLIAWQVMRRAVSFGR